jgi:phenylalanyl-tRNA synthetase beta chain
MKISENWLRELVNPPVDSAQLAHQLTMAGLEVDGLHPVAGVFKRVVVAQILERQVHPTSEKYAVYIVDVGASEPIQIVSICTDLAVNTKLACVLVGGEIDGLEITVRDFAGVSSFGMFCAGSTLGLEREHNKQILFFAEDALVGTEVRKYLQLDDKIIDIDLTPNRGDCLSARGIAREVAAMNNSCYTPAAIDAVPSDIDQTYPINIQDTSACPHYCARIITHIDISALTPVWMQEKILRSGLATNNIIIDIANYVMLEIGQPLHAFDLATLNGELTVRFARDKEKVTLLNQQQVTLDASTLVISDQEKISAIAGIMGSDDTSVSDTTDSILLESAFFDPLVLASKARKYGLNADAAYRFERGVDDSLQIAGLERAAYLLQKHAGAKVAQIVQIGASKPLTTISLVVSKINKLLAIDLAATNIMQMLTNLGCTCTLDTEQEIVVTVPSHRFDLQIEADLVEEIARLYGYDNLPATQPQINIEQVITATTIAQECINSLLHRGYTQAITYSFIDKKLNQLFSQGDNINLANPISEQLSSMRSCLWPGLVKAIEYNHKRQNFGVSLIEQGNKFALAGDGKIEQLEVIAGAIAADTQYIDNWQVKQPVSFYTVKGDLESVLYTYSDESEISFQDVSYPSLHPGQSAAIYYQQQLIGYIGKLHPQLEKHFALPELPWVFELFVDKLPSNVQHGIKEVSSFPQIKRDLSLEVDKPISYAKIKEQIRAVSGEYLTQLELFDVYTGDKVATGKKSIAINLTWQHPERTLADSEINAEISQITEHLKQQLDISLRG